jgi:hypothetical protein
MTRQLARRGRGPAAVVLFALLLAPLLQACGGDEAETPAPQAGGIVMTVEPTAAAPDATEPATEAATEPATEAATGAPAEAGAGTEAAATEAVTETAGVTATEGMTEAGTDVATESATESATEAAAETTGAAGTAATEPAVEPATEVTAAAPAATQEAPAEPVVTLSVGETFTTALPVRVYAMPGEESPAIALYNQGTAFIVIEPDLEHLDYPVLVEGQAWLRVRAEDGLAGWVLAGVTE